MTSMLWIGGSPGSGKSTIARRLARGGDLPLHPVDLWTYDRRGFGVSRPGTVQT